MLTNMISDFIPNIPDTGQKRIVIAGGGFGGLKAARKLAYNNFQIVLLDKNNYHQFQPLFYQVATSGLEPAAIAFPLRKVFQKKTNVHFRMARIEEVHPEINEITTSIGKLHYDYLILATGVSTNYFGMQQVKENSIPMKSISEAIYLRNYILKNYEAALQQTVTSEIEAFMTICVVGGGPTGVELAGALAEMKRYILPKDYPELDFSLMKVYLFEASGKLLNGMSAQASSKAEKYLRRMGVNIFPGTAVKDYDGKTITLANGKKINSKTLVWAAGVTGKPIAGIPAELITRTNRILVDEVNLILGYPNIFAIGDICCMKTVNYPNGHPQVAQVAIQQARLVANNIIRIEKNKPKRPFHYINKGAMATIGRNLAVADLPGFRVHGFIAWILWLFVHLMSLVGIKNRFLIFINWVWNYITFDQSLRLLIKPKIKH